MSINLPFIPLRESSALVFRRFSCS